jgi:hypothetical protein
MSLEPKQVKAANLLAKGQSQTQTAQAIGVSRRTIVRWLSQAEFKNLCFGLSGDVQPVARSIHSIELEKPIQVRGQSNNLTVEDLVGDALQAVQDILSNPEARPGDRLKAASLIGEWAGMAHRGKVHELQASVLLRDLGFLPRESVELVQIAYEECQQKIKQAMRVEEEPSLYEEDESWLHELEEEE